MKTSEGFHRADNTEDAKLLLGQFETLLTELSESASKSTDVFSLGEKVTLVINEPEEWEALFEDSATGEALIQRSLSLGVQVIFVADGSRLRSMGKVTRYVKGISNGLLLGKQDVQVFSVNRSSDIPVRVNEGVLCAPEGYRKIRLPLYVEDIN